MKVDKNFPLIQRAWEWAQWFWRFSCLGAKIEVWMIENEMEKAMRKAWRDDKIVLAAKVHSPGRIIRKSKSLLTYFWGLQRLRSW